MKTEARDRLILGLTIHDLIGYINELMRKYNLKFKLSYYHYTYYEAVLSVSSGDGMFHEVMRANPRNHSFWWSAAFDTNIEACMIELRKFLADNSASLRLACNKRKDGVPMAKLQIYVEGSTFTALTLMEVRKKTFKTYTKFDLPGESST